MSARSPALRKAMSRQAAFEALAQLRDDAIVVAAYSAAFEWHAVDPHDLNYFAIGAMGQASSHGLGFALAQPQRRIIVLDGDGSLLMNLGSLVTIAGASPPNLVHIVCENGIYEVNGGHPLPGGEQVDFAGLARAAGYPHVFAFDELDEWTTALPGILEKQGPVLVSLKLVGTRPLTLDYRIMHGADQRKRFAKGLQQQIRPETIG